MKQEELPLESQYGRTSQAHCDQTKEKISELFSTPWQTAGRWDLNGECLTHSSSESPPAEDVCFSSLSTILESDAPNLATFYLSSRSIGGVYDRIQTQLSVFTEHTGDTTNHNKDLPQLSKPSRRSVLLALATHLDDSLRQNMNV
jgi:hypothetical protein